MKIHEVMIDEDEKIRDWMDSVGANAGYLSYKVKDGEIYINGGSMMLNHRNLEQIPYKFADMLDVSFKVHNNHLHTLKNCPSKCKDFDADCNMLKSLEGGPREVSGSYTAYNNQLITLKGCPTFVGDIFDVQVNRLTEIDAAPATILGDWDLSENNLTSLKDIDKHCKRCHGDIRIGGNPIKSHLLGLLKIKGVEHISSYSDDSKEMRKAIMIVNKYLGKGKQGILDCQSELMDNDLDDFAEL